MASFQLQPRFKYRLFQLQFVASSTNTKDIKANQTTKLPNNYHSTHLNFNFQQSFAIREKLFFPIASSIPIFSAGNTFT